MEDIDPHYINEKAVTRDMILMELQNNGEMRVGEIAVRTHPESYALLFGDPEDVLVEWEWHRIAVGATLIMMYDDSEVWKVMDPDEYSTNPTYMLPT